MSGRRAVVLLSGGLDSTTCLAMARAQGFEPVCLCVSYGQRHRVELERARKVAQEMGVSDVRVVSLDLRAIGGSALTDDIAVPKDRSESEMGAGIPETYVPARNTVFLALALGLAEVVGASDIFIGVNALDYSGYPDCRPEYIRAYEQMATLATRAGIEGHAPVVIRTPLIDLTKREIIQLGQRLGVDYALTTSCYDPAPDGAACGHCDACQLRLRGFLEAGTDDPARYQEESEARAAGQTSA